MRRSIWFALVIGLALAAGCQPQAEPSKPSETNASGTSSATAPKDPPADPATEPAAVAFQPAADLKHSGYEYYGLSRTQALTFKVTRDGADMGEGTQVVNAPKDAAGPAVFEIVREGSLSGVGNQTVELRKDGIFTTMLAGNALKTPMLELPATLVAGTKWSSNGTLTLGDGSSTTMKMDYKIVGAESVKAGGKTYDALKLTSSGTMTIQDVTHKTTGTMWLVKGIGAVKTTMKIDMGKGKTTETTMEVTGS